MHESGFGRVIGVLISPDKTFRSIAERPTWVVPLLLLVLLGTSLALLIQKKADQDEMIQFQIEQMEKFGMEMSQEQREKMEQEMESRAAAMEKVNLVLLPLVFTVTYFILAAVFLGVFRLAGSEIGYIPSLATTVHGLLPMGVAALLNLPLVWSRASVTREEAMQGGILVSNPGPLAPEESPVLAAVLGSLDFFALWSVVLLIFGFRAVARVSTQTATTVLLVLWGLMVLIKVGWAAVFN